MLQSIFGATLLPSCSGMEKFFPAEKITLSGNPVRKDLIDAKGKKAKAAVQAANQKANQKAKVNLSLKKRKNQNLKRKRKRIKKKIRRKVKKRKRKR